MIQKSPILIILNGASSSGKTCTAEALLNLLGSSCVHTGLDEILNRLQPFGSEGVGSLQKLQRSIRILWFHFTNGRLRLFKKLHREVVALVEAGHDVILETSLMDELALQDAALCFAPSGGLFVGMKPPLVISEQWEAERGDRLPGQARKHYHLIHAHGIYDLILDPSQMTPDECALAILRRWEGPPPDAFRRLLG